MYICSCHAVTDGTIKRSAKSGCPNFRTLCQETGLATQCGKCAIHAKEIFDAARDEVDSTAGGDKRD